MWETLELKRVRKYEDTFNGDFAADYPDYVNSVSTILKKIRSHMSPLKTILGSFCPRRRPRAANERILYNVQDKSVFDISALGNGSYEPDLFDLSSYPPVVQGLFTELLRFFKAEEECMDICIGILEEERRLRNNPQECKFLLDDYRRDAYDRFKNLVTLFAEDTIAALRATNQVYIRRQEYATEETFAANEFHKHTHKDMDHYVLIESLSAADDITPEERALWGSNPKDVKKIRFAVDHFDELLPEDFKHTKMGLYEYIFCQWALPGNIKGATEYFIKHYRGKYKTTRYAGVNKHCREYDKDSDNVKNFISRIIRVL